MYKGCQASIWPPPQTTNWCPRDHFLNFLEPVSLRHSSPDWLDREAIGKISGFTSWEVPATFNKCSVASVGTYGKAGNGNETETENGNWKRKTGNWKQKWKRNFFAAVVLARFNCCYPSALPASSFCFASLASLAWFPDLWCPSCSVMCDCLVFFTLVVQVIVYVLSSVLSLVFCNQLILYKCALYMRWMFESEHQ